VSSYSAEKYKMERGYIKLWRKSLDSGLLQNPKIWTFWSWCLMKATHKKRSQMIGFQKVKLLPGQFVFGRRTASKELSLSEQTIRTCVTRLSKMGKLTTKPTNKFSIITIINWGSYQADQTTVNHQINPVATQCQPSANHKQECKNVKTNTLHASTDQSGTESVSDPKRSRPSPSPLRSDIVEIVEDLNNGLGSKTIAKPFNPANNATENLIFTWYGLGYTKPDFLAVNAHKTKQWGNDEKMKKNLRPATLYALKYFEAYVNEAIIDKNPVKVNETKLAPPEIYEQTVTRLNRDGPDKCQEYLSEKLGLDGLEVESYISQAKERGDYIEK